MYLHFESYYISKGTYHCQEQKKCQNNALNLHFFSLRTDAFFSTVYSLLPLIPWAEKNIFFFTIRCFFLVIPSNELFTRKVFVVEDEVSRKISNTSSTLWLRLTYQVYMYIYKVDSLWWTSFWIFCILWYNVSSIVLKEERVGYWKKMVGAKLALKILSIIDKCQKLVFS